ncbi:MULTISPECIES: ATP-binding protein [unclassified Hydrogenophaga]|uniref:hybrid sensor histidine kinase/response regulator n=1 Tax=unclassified Hydrogenophaga TaxID=2610897 RepID=UPI00095981AE|nr:MULTISPECIES: ATP-binding protein [unclassified Hydrogenophaga]MBN9370922.1 PAS domain S-box protein [Hydrogenophaga sp.]OJV35614.1 MAG: hypothetical protein BGO22_12215 [Hydrogenophaga sp. 70-12]
MNVQAPDPPGARFTVPFGGTPTALSAASRALEARLPGHWSDWSIVAPAARAALLAALRQTRPFALSLRLLDDAHGQPVHVRCQGHWQAARLSHLCQLADISDLQAAHDTTGHALLQLQEMVDSLPLLVIQLDTSPELRCAFAAGSLLRLLVPYQQNPVGQAALGLFGPALFAHLRQEIQAIQPAGGARPFIWRAHDDQGQLRVLEGTLRTLIDSQGRPSGHLLDSLETTAYHATMAALTASEERLRRFVIASSDAIVVHMDERIVDANPAACRLLSTTAEALRERRFLDLIATEDQAACLAHADAASHEAQECHLVDRHGTRIAVELIGRTVQRKGQRMRMAIVRDVRDRREAQARIHELINHLSAQRDRAEAADRAKSLFLSAASHDLRQPIHALGLFLTSLETLVQSRYLPLPALEQVTRRMGASLDALGRLLNSLLDVSRLDANAVVVHPIAVPLAPLFGELAADLGDAASSKGLRLDVVPTRAWVFTDPVVLRRIVDNLVSNAIRYTRQGRVLVGARPRGACVELQVWDSGIGIAADQLDAIFGEFYQVSPASASDSGLRGLGLGLSIVKRSAKLLDARLNVRSAPGRGSMFSITVPRGTPAAAPLAPPPSPAAKRRASSAPRRVLVIDDDAMVLQAMQQLLQAWGHQVWCAADQDQAVMLAITHAEEIDLVLSDYHLGGQVDAAQFIGTVRACLVRPVPVHVFTADTSVPVAQNIRALGLSLLHKPVQHDLLRQVLEQG